MNHRNPFVANGIKYGYPPCCIEFFCTRIMQKTNDQIRASCFTGFIPCPECTKKVLSGETTLAGLIKDRLLKSPFPYDDVPGDYSYYLRYLNTGKFPTDEEIENR